MTKLLRLSILLLLISFNGYGQIVIEDFSDPKMLGWFSGAPSQITLTHVNDGTLLVKADSVGADYEGFGKNFSALDMSKHTKITIKIKIPDTLPAPTIRMDLRDNNGYDSNYYPVSVTVTPTGEFVTYTLNYRSRLRNSNSAWLNSKSIVRLYIFINAGAALANRWTGSLYIDDIILEDAQKPDMLTFGSEWKYFDGGTEQAGWKTLDYDDSNWFTGVAPIGYGLPEIATVVDDTDPKTITQYFRKTIYISDTSAYKNLILNSRSGDGIIVYLNEEEVYRHNMPAGTVTQVTPADSELTAEELLAEKRYVFPIAPLDSGMNIIAAEVHRNTDTGDYLSFDLELTGSFYDFGIIRGPYLQAGTDTSIVIRWRTLEETLGRVRFGTDPAALDQIVDSAGLRIDHEILLTGLQPGTKYYYGIGTPDSIYKGGDEEHYFITSPVQGTEQAVRIWAIGDAGYGNTDSRAMRDAYYTFSQGIHTDAFLLLGDNAYTEGFDAEYQASMFENMYENLMNKTVTWPTPGNHDLGLHIELNTEAPYYDIFTVPVDGEAGGVPSGTEAYYSFNYGNIHFISLDSHGTPRDSVEAMATWLKSDLQANDQKWLIAYWHHPPYSKGTHDSDDPDDSGGRLIEMREQILPILERYGVDLIMTGHSHVYERSYMIHGHYGFSSTFLDEPHVVNEVSSGKKSLGEEYYKNPDDANYPDIGTVYPVIGCSGMSSKSADWEDQPDNLISKSLMYTYTRKDVGSFVIDVHKDTLTAIFLTSKGEVKDDFTIIKDNTRTIALVQGEIKLGIHDPARSEANIMNAYPNPFAETTTLEYRLEKNAKVTLEVFDELGHKVETLYSGKQSAGTYIYRFSSKKGGTYIARLTAGKNTYSKKIILVK